MWQKTVSRKRLCQSWFESLNYPLAFICNHFVANKNACLFICILIINLSGLHIPPLVFKGLSLIVLAAFSGLVLNTCNQYPSCPFWWGKETEVPSHRKTVYSVHQSLSWLFSGKFLNIPLKEVVSSWFFSNWKPLSMRLWQKHKISSLYLFPSIDNTSLFKAGFPKKHKN